MKTLQQIREEIEVNEAEDKKLTTLIRAGLFDVRKLPLLKRALSKDNTKMSPTERNSLLDLLDTLIAHVTGDAGVYTKVRHNVMHEDINEVYEVAGELPMILILKRRSIRAFPDGQRVALYWADKLKTFISVPYSSVGVGYSPAVSEEVTLVAEEPVEEAKKETGFFDDMDRGVDSLRKKDAKTADKQKKSNSKLFNKIANKKTVKEDDVEEAMKAKRPSDFAGFAVAPKNIKIRPEAVYRSKSSGWDALPKQVQDAMKKKKEVKEDDVQELDKKTLVSYANKAHTDRDWQKRDSALYLKAANSADSKDRPDIASQRISHAISADKNVKKRTAGIDLANKKIAKIESKPKRLGENLETLEDIVNENAQKLLNFDDGGSTTIGPFTASAILEVYNAINDDNKAKMKASLNESRAAFNKMAEFALSKV